MLAARLENIFYILHTFFFLLCEIYSNLYILCNNYFSPLSGKIFRLVIRVFFYRKYFDILLRNALEKSDWLKRSHTEFIKNIYNRESRPFILRVGGVDKCRAKRGALKMVWKRLLSYLFRSREKENADNRHKAMAAFRRRYLSFKELLQANADLALILAGLTQVQLGEKSLQTRELRKQARRSILLSQRMTMALNAMSANRYMALTEVCDKIGERIEKELRKHARGDLPGLTLPLTEVDASMAYIVGAKNANLGEAAAVLNFKIPRGFALSIKAGTIFLLRNGDLMQNIYKQLARVDVDRPHTIRNCARAVAALIQEAPVPDAIMEEALATWDAVFGKDSPSVLVALRSSAVAEDGVQSFAGQYESVLGVTRETLPGAIKQVIGSLFSDRALTYRASHGYALDATGMALCCVEMVRAKAAGVAFSRHPVDLHSSCVVINGVWGLGEAVVDGSSAVDQWLVSRASGKIREFRIASKSTARELVNEDGIWKTEAMPLSAEKAEMPCLTDAQATTVASMAMALERHYQYPQDIEWALDEDGQIVLLQCRPLSLDCSSPEYSGDDSQSVGMGSFMPILQGGDIASRGVACGKLVHVNPNQEMGHLPEGAILVAENSSPNIMTVLRKAGALLAENGSLTGHMASICREFGIPAIFNLPGVYKNLAEGQTVTVDALAGRVFDGEVPPLLELQRPKALPLPDTPALAMLRRVSVYILPLTLIDPSSVNFTARNCASLHDVMRYAHEKSYAEMFQISDDLSDSGISGVAARLDSQIPLDLYVIDLGGGLNEKGKSVIKPDDIISIPFKNLLAGMLNPALHSKEPRPVDLRGFLSVMEQSMVGGNLRAGERFGDRSYAIISDKYLNFSSRVGYHYAIVDSWCGDSINKNYIRFEFAGGAAGDVQRIRRARCIGIILDELGFTVEQSHDRIRARFQKYPVAENAVRLDQLGRLLIMTRQMDMLMVNEESVSIFAGKFLKGEYH